LKPRSKTRSSRNEGRKKEPKGAKRGVHRVALLEMLGGTMA